MINSKDKSENYDMKMIKFVCQLIMDKRDDKDVFCYITSVGETYIKQVLNGEIDELKNATMKSVLNIKGFIEHQERQKIEFG